MQGVVARLWRPVAAAALVHLLFLAVYLAKHHGDPSVLVCAGSQRTGFPPYEYITRTVGPSGHDGQFYYSLARRRGAATGRTSTLRQGGTCASATRPFAG